MSGGGSKESAVRIHVNPNDEWGDDQVVAWSQAKLTTAPQLSPERQQDLLQVRNPAQGKPPAH